MLAAAADLLDQGQTVNRLSIALTAIGLGVLLVPMVPLSDATQPTAAIVAVLGVGRALLSPCASRSAPRNSAGSPKTPRPSGSTSPPSTRRCVALKFMTAEAGRQADRPGASSSPAAF